LQDKKNSSVFLVRVAAVWTVMQMDLLKRVHVATIKNKRRWARIRMDIEIGLRDDDLDHSLLACEQAPGWF